MVLDRVASYAIASDADRAWKQWLRRLDGEAESATRQHARVLDIGMRVTRDKLVAHIGIDAKLTWGTAGPGTTNFGAVRIPWREVPEGSWTELQTTCQALGLMTGDRTNPVDVMALMEGLRTHADRLDERGRNAYRAAAKSVGLESVTLVDVTWRVIELVRSFGA
jgi:hypothetical protein